MAAFLTSPSLRFPVKRTPAISHHSTHKIPIRASAQSFRIGHGFDLHRLEPGLPLILGGVKLEHDRGCAGHSDGDAIYHCVVDSVLGALSLPDIGQLFPDTDPRFKDCESHVFMNAAYEQMTNKGYKVGNVDVTIILERPKMSPHKALIRQNIAQLLRTDVENINVKAKTHEKVDAVGENRAVSVHAVAMLVPIVEDGTLKANVIGAKESKGEILTNDMLGMLGNRMKAIQDITTASGNGKSSGAIEELYKTVWDRRGADPSSSWTAKLFSKGRGKIAQKVGEEAVEVVIDATSGKREGVIKESADLIYHLSVLWADMDITPEDVWNELRSREGTSGIAEKKSRK